MFANLKTQLNASAAGQWYNGRSESDRLILRLVALGLGVLLAWTFFWQPVDGWRDDQKDRFTRTQNDIDWLTRNQQRARQAAAVSTAGGGGSKLAAITNVAESQGLTIDQVRPESGGAVTVQIRKQAFNSIVRWLNALQNQHRLSVLRADFDATDTSGYVSAQFRLQ